MIIAREVTLLTTMMVRTSRDSYCILFSFFLFYLCIYAQCTMPTNTAAWQRVTIVQLQCLVAAVRAVGVTAMRRFATRTVVANTPIHRFTLTLMIDA